MTITWEELDKRMAKIPAAWSVEEERRMLKKYAELSQGPILEIGVAWGGSTVIFLSCSDYPVDSVDPLNVIIDGWNITPKMCSETVERAVNDISKWHLFCQKSHEFWQSWMRKDEAFYGLIYIDGSHDYKAVRQDVDDWLPFLFKGNYLLLHDSLRDPNQPEEGRLCGYPGPTQAAQELLSDNRVKLIDKAYSLTVWQKI